MPRPGTPRLVQHQIYWQAYSVHSLVEELLRQYPPVWPENRASFWARLRVVFQVYQDGLPLIDRWEHIPSRGGDFFSRTTPEGAILDRARLPDSLVARLLLGLTTTQPRPGVGRERVSFRELDIEQLGAVYEGLLEHEPRLARETTLELKMQGRLLALTPEDTVRLCREKHLAVKGDMALVVGTAAEILHPQAAAPEDDTQDMEALEVEEPEAEGEELEEADQGIKKGAAARLLRRLEPGDFHFVPSPERKGSGSLYTPLPLVWDLVRHALGPLVAGKSAAESRPCGCWTRPAAAPTSWWRPCATWGRPCTGLTARNWTARPRPSSAAPPARAGTPTGGRRMTRPGPRPRRPGPGASAASPSAASTEWT